MPDSTRFIDINNRPPFYVAPRPNRPQLLVDDRGIYLADPDGNTIGLDGNRDRGKTMTASRAGTREG